MTVNRLSPFVSTNTLLPLLRQTTSFPDADVCIINVISVAYTYVPNAQFESETNLNGPVTGNSTNAQLKRYGFSKLANILWTRALTRRLRLLDGPSTDSGSARNTQDRGIICLSVHPGQIATEGNLAFAKQLPWLFSTLYRILVCWLHGTPAEGAQEVLLAIAAPQVREDADKHAGMYLESVGKITTPATKAALCDQLTENLWALTERVVEEEGL